MDDPPRMKEAPRRIVVFAHEVRRDGGMERAMMETIAGLLEMGWHVRLVARVCELEDHPRLHWVRVRTPRRPFLLAFPAYTLVASILMVGARRRPGLVISLGAIILNRVDMVIVQFCHAAFARQGIIRPSRENPVHRFHSRVSQKLALGLERWCYRPGRVGRMIAVSDLVKQELESHYRFPSAAVEVIPNGVDLDRFRPDEAIRMSERQRLGLSRHEPVVLFVGGDWQRKGLDIAIEAAGQAGWRLLVVGRGDALTWGTKSREQGVQVTFCGHLTSPERVYCAADAFVLPSRYEGFALVTIEAAASGLPLLVTEATGAAPLAESAGIGALPRDANAFAAQLRRLAEDSQLRADVGVRARAAAEQLAWPRIVSAYASALSRAQPLLPNPPYHGARVAQGDAEVQTLGGAIRDSVKAAGEQGGHGSL